MSRGPGRWQRRLLELVDEYNYVPVETVVWNTMVDQGRKPTRADHVAARRAARRLAEQGKVRAVYVRRCANCGECSTSWFSCCGPVRYALAVTTDPEIKTWCLRSMPSWVDDPDREERERSIAEFMLSVARGQQTGEATLTYSQATGGGES